MSPPRLHTRAARLLSVALTLACLLWPGARAAAGPSEDAVREVGALMAQKRWKQAVEVARQAPVREATRASLLGLIAMRAGAYKQAVASFEQALELGPKRPTLYLYLAWSHHALKQPKQAREALSEIKSKADRVAMYWLLQGRLARDAGQASSAYALLLQGLKRFPKDRALRRELGYVLVEFGALHQARAWLVPLFTGAGDDEVLWTDAVGLLRALSARERHDEAIFYTELLRARLPARAAQIDALAAHLYARRGAPRAAARLFARATLRGGASFAFEAADQYRVAGDTREALRWNARLAPTSKHTRQRFLILTEAGRWPQAALVARKITPKTGAQGDAMRHRMALAWLLGARDVPRAQKIARAIQGASLRDSIDDWITRCRREPWTCR